MQKHCKHKLYVANSQIFCILQLLTIRTFTDKDFHVHDSKAALNLLRSGNCMSIHIIQNYSVNEVVCMYRQLLKWEQNTACLQNVRRLLFIQLFKLHHNSSYYMQEKINTHETSSNKPSTNNTSTLSKSDSLLNH